MDTHTNPQTPHISAKQPTGCCSGKAGARPQAKAEPHTAEIADDKPGKSGCCGSQN